MAAYHQNIGIQTKEFTESPGTGVYFISMVNVMHIIPMNAITSGLVGGFWMLKIPRLPVVFVLGAIFLPFDGKNLNIEALEKKMKHKVWRY